MNQQMQNNRGGQLSTNQKQENLMQALSNDQVYVQALLKNSDLDEFGTNLQELAANDYLMDKIPPLQVVRVAAQATSMGLSINPYHKECYILPFNVKGKGMVPMITVSKRGSREVAFQSGFFLKIDPVWRVNGQAKKESGMSLDEKDTLNATDPNFFRKNMMGWHFDLEDISTNDVKVPDQDFFVPLTYAISVTNNMEAPDNSLMQAYVHKATRRAMGEFYIPRHRNSNMLKMMKIDDDSAIDVSFVNKDGGNKTTPVDQLSQLGESTENSSEPSEGELRKSINDEYNNAEPKAQSCIGKLLQGAHPEWRKYNSSQLAALLADVKDC